MSRFFNTRVQTFMVVLLFLGSLGVLLYNTLTTLALPQRELEARIQLRSASEALARDAGDITNLLRARTSKNREALDGRLRQIANKVLTEYPNVEGGFYIARDKTFGGYAYPTTEHKIDAPSRNEPPPLEAPLIRGQAEQSLNSGEKLLRTEDVGPSRVVIITEPVGTWPAELTTWLMIRLSGPELLAKQLRRAEASTYLALIGVAVALLLTWNLERTLKRQRAEQIRLRDELRHTEHLAGLGKLLAGVAHEIRNPLAALRSTVQLWQRLPESTRTPDSLDAVVQAVDRLNTIVSRLLYFARSDNAERRAVDLNKLLSETLDLIAAQATDQSVHLERNFADILPHVSGSSHALREVVLNLLTNALQAMPDGGTLTCATQSRLGTGQVEILISDTGSGISAENRRHLFEPFFTTRTEGTGLGLALCREIATNHNGTIECLPDETFKTTFRIILPEGGR